ncbi:MAG: type II toxin-antitoxin system HicA family toxin [Candidatus Aenigmarchaeota archaeon]|nr:type II toxin-antitoxin system HicA family toxin [Candidatus Aenigmarchaeota archaeon]
MSKLPVLSGSKVIKILEKIGFEPKRQKGSHIILIKDKIQKRIVVVLLHKEIDKGTLIEIIRQANLKRDEFLDLLK